MNLGVLLLCEHFATKKIVKIFLFVRVLTSFVNNEKSQLGESDQLFFVDMTVKREVNVNYIKNFLNSKFLFIYSRFNCIVFPFIINNHQ